jgi:hypothetical protein
MTDQDKEYLRDLFAGFAMCGVTMDGSISSIAFTEKKEVAKEIATLAYEIADAMMEARDKEESYAEKGITAIKKRAYTRKADE